MNPVRTSVSPAREPGSPGLARVFGRSTPVSLANYDPDTSSWRTSQLSLLEEWESFSGTWPRSGMTRSTIAYQLAPLAPLTAATGSGLLPTPLATSYGSNQGGAAGRVGPVRHSLGSMAAHDLWPTPTASDGKGGGRTGDPMTTRGRKRHSNLRDKQVAPSGGPLSPQWVAVLMGYPPDWTEAE